MCKTGITIYYSNIVQSEMQLLEITAVIITNVQNEEKQFSSADL